MKKDKLEIGGGFAGGNQSQNLDHQQLITEPQSSMIDLGTTSINLEQTWIVLMGCIRGQPKLTTKQKAHIAGMSHGQVARIVGSGQTTVSLIVPRARTQSLNKMKEAIQQGWDDIPVDHLKSLVKSMPNQMCLVVEASGGPIKY
ncbi:hypothetical protein PGT21_031745 [Puccinia graminis f. sp. tritici]|uniref:Uncharacterized protein n=1 Tax=Puccinia graminis f. sp. tritici TaxID=56615 RepID=A0A5B0MQ56_PUCGR|nr:hypothetical protein PGTUg99_007262 [Puccinia graminis f. sp. tritici]KAA1094868.1 hypothetical protein PGT21_031745 [Puccinia graminis f. sp. tritici]